MTGRARKGLWLGGAGIALLAGCVGLCELVSPTTRLTVTIENRTDQPLTLGRFGPGSHRMQLARPPLDWIPAHATITHAVENPERGSVIFLHYRIRGTYDDSVMCGYVGIPGIKAMHTWIVAEGDTLREDSSMTIGGGDTTVIRAAQSVVQVVAETAAKP